MVPSALTIVGPGLIGTSVALAARRAWPGADVRTVDRGEPLDAVRGAEVVVLSAPVDVIIEQLPAIAPLVAPRALVIDTGSTKEQILSAAARAGLRNFVGGHPMAGGTTSGPGAALADLFDGKPWFLLGDLAPPEMLAEAGRFVTELGAEAVAMAGGGAEHDAVMAAISHLPQVVASTLMIVAAEAAGAEGLQWAGGGLRDTTRLAASSAEMWRPILASNRAHLEPLVRRTAERLLALAERLDDADTVARLFDDAARAKRSCL